MNSQSNFGNSNYILPSNSNLDSASELRIVKHTNQMLQQQIHELKIRYNNLKKQQEIYHHIQCSQNDKKIKLSQSHAKQINEKEDAEKLLKQEIKYLKKQLMTSMTDRQNLQNQLAQLKQKNIDLKYHNQQLKSLNQKITDIHKRQIGILTKDIQSNAEIEEIKTQKQMLSNKLEKCKEIVKEMEEFYSKQIQQLKHQIKQLRQQNHILRENINIIEMERQDMENQWQQNQNIQNIFNQAERKKTIQKEQEQFSTIIKSQSNDKKWELKIQQLKEMYERQIITLKDKIKYLIVKLQSAQDENRLIEHNLHQPTTTNFTHLNPNNVSLDSNNSFLGQSKILLYSGGSNDSFRLTPHPTSNNSFSSSIKQSLTRREINCLKTPNKYHKNVYGVLTDKNL